jgi:hypothetical protein
MFPIVILSNPNKGALFFETPSEEWQPYTAQEHNFLFFQLNQIRNERNYFDAMHRFWFEWYRIEQTGVCRVPRLSSSVKKHLRLVLVLFLILLGCFVVYLIWKYMQQRKKGRLLSPRSPAPLLSHPRRISA